MEKKILGIMVPLTSDKLINYDAWFMRQQDATEIVFNPNRSIDAFPDSLKLPNSRIQNKERLKYTWAYKKDIFENFLQSIICNDFNSVSLFINDKYFINVME